MGCFYCGLESDGNSTCPHCGDVQYCSESHRLLHCLPERPAEQQQQQPDSSACFPFVVRHSGDACGRFMVASRDIRKGETILAEQPFLVAPSSKSAAVCLHCFRSTPTWKRGSRQPTDQEEQVQQQDDVEEQLERKEEPEEDPHRCSKCLLPLCDLKECRGEGSNHTQQECDILCAAMNRMSDEKRRKFLESTKFDGRPCLLYASVGPLRLLLASENQRDKWKGDISTLMDHAEERRKDVKTWMLNHVHIVGFLKGACRLGDRFSDQDIHKAIGILRTNAVRLDGQQIGSQAIACGLYALYSLLNHSCLPNTRTRKSPRRGHTMEVVALADIAKGEQICTRYTTPMWGTFRRQQVLQRHWYFTCRCQRCTDPTELGTMLNALRCQQEGCPEGILLPLEPTNLDSPWHCSVCSGSISGGKASGTFLAAEAQVEKLSSVWQAVDGGGGPAILAKLTRTTLHPHNFLLVRLREKMVMQQVKRQSSSSDPKEVEDCLRMQQRLLVEMRRIMVNADPPGDLWDETISKIEQHLVRLAALCNG